MKNLSIILASIVALAAYANATVYTYNWESLPSDDNYLSLSGGKTWDIAFGEDIVMTVTFSGDWAQKGAGSNDLFSLSNNQGYDFVSTIEFSFNQKVTNFSLTFGNLEIRDNFIDQVRIDGATYKLNGATLVEYPEYSWVQHTQGGGTEATVKAAQDSFVVQYRPVQTGTGTVPYWSTISFNNISFDTDLSSIVNPSGPLNQTPEPATYAAIFGFALVGYVTLKHRRSAKA